MCIQPNDNWQWHYDAHDDRLMLDLSDRMIFATEYKGRQLVPSAFTTQAFCVDDAALYYQLMDRVAELEWSVPHQVQLVLNAIAVSRFYKPLMPQSWFFGETHPAIIPETGALLCMGTPHGKGEFLVIEAGEQASVCLNLTDDLILTTSKTLPRFGVIKVMNNRMSPRPVAQAQYRQVS
ncbi:cell division protein ZapC [Aeromonas hydrophila]|uniref:cell division protein ZapC n=1 Tax=Aeromonas hydrophila TaxID=644 RepID=UPI001914E916|nr:cell division protein ZapC [Aeromonas hydrophila]MBQ4676902.1 cell division protein ZapC [Aeromonas hydrophila]MBW3813507.1 cell division protein ZapC [Aeromonas hydrophila]MCF7678738.1 cell division protein ZapC [Aeromonas hydrophila]MCF7691786.1 cell division protein ZapC [Aeromonas hydrophila]MCF7772586.1 cell division protein ZapC [Aeromonas hydrophila]